MIIILLADDHRRGSGCKYPGFLSIVWRAVILAFDTRTIVLRRKQNKVFPLLNYNHSLHTAFGVDMKNDCKQMSCLLPYDNIVYRLF
jgi:hypothetical protein